MVDFNKILFFSSGLCDCTVSVGRGEIVDGTAVKFFLVKSLDFIKSFIRFFLGMKLLIFLFFNIKKNDLLKYSYVLDNDEHLSFRYKGRC